MQTCEVGLFRLPGLDFSKTPLPTDLEEQIKAWLSECNIEVFIYGTLWSFKYPGDREMVILKWGEHIT
jgi:hypothetical protein